MNTEASSSAPGQNTGAPASVQAARALLKELQAQFAVFKEARPLAIGIDKALLARLPDLDKKALRTALRIHTHSTAYLKATAKGTHRFDLDGNPGETLDDAHRAHAETTLNERFKKIAEQKKAQRAAEEAERRHAAKLEQLAAKFAKR